MNRNCAAQAPVLQPAHDDPTANFARHPCLSHRLGIESGEKSPRPEWQESLFLALAHGHPGLASGPVDRGALLALHRQAWNIAGLNEDDPWKELLKIADPVERAAVASKTGFPLTEADLSSVILEAVASRPTEAQRAAIALVLYLSLRSSRRIAATAAETLASQLSRVLRPFTTTHNVYGKELQSCREAASVCSGLEDTPRDKYARNLLNAFLPDGYSDITPQELHAEFIRLWERFGVTIADAKNKS